MGENGAGKSTLGKILAGVIVTDEGGILLAGNPIHAPNSLAARHLRIAMVHQELAFWPDLPVAEKLCLGAMPAAAGWLDQRHLRAQEREAWLEAVTNDPLLPGRILPVSNERDRLPGRAFPRNRHTGRVPHGIGRW